MTDDIKTEAQKFVSFLQSLSEEERVEGNEKERRRAEKQHKDFQAHFQQDKCFLCGDELTTFKKERPCPHWLLRPPGFTKWHFMEVARSYGCVQLQAFLRWVASEEAFAKNINDLADEGTGKLIELTIRYQTYEWSFSCGESDFQGHSSSSEESNRPHYHFQMRVNKQAFIRFNDFHVPFSREDILLMEAQRLAPETLHQRFSGGAGMSDILHEDILDQLVMSGTTAENEDDAPLDLSTIIIADKGTMISGDDLANLFAEARRKRVPIASLVHKLPNINARTIIAPGPGVVEQAPRSGRKKKPKK